MTDVTLEPGWLKRDMERAAAELCATHDRSFYSFDRRVHQQQLNPKEIQQLAEILEQRFQSWTGFSLADFRRSEA